MTHQIRPYRNRHELLATLPADRFIPLGEAAQIMGVSRRNLADNYLRDIYCPEWIEIIRDNGRIIGLRRKEDDQ